MTLSQQKMCLHTLISPLHLMPFSSLTHQGIALVEICPMVPSVCTQHPLLLCQPPSRFQISLCLLHHAYHCGTCSGCAGSPAGRFLPSLTSPGVTPGRNLAMRNCSRNMATRLHAGADPSKMFTAYLWVVSLMCAGGEKILRVSTLQRHPEGF